MDEPTSSLSAAEAQRLFEVVEQLRAEGQCVVYISHRLSEVLALADRIVVLRDGTRVGELPSATASHDAMVRMMVGRDVEEFYVRRPHPIGKAVLRVEGLETQRFAGHRVDLELRRGEIVGLAGLVGAGRSEVLRAIFGVDVPRAGKVSVAGEELPRGDVGRAAKRGLAFVPEERKADGLLLDAGVSENLSIASLDALQRFGLLELGRERERNARLVQELGIKTPSLGQPVRFLSGGNQQKVVLGKWLVRQPLVLLLDEPTRGIDIGAKQEVYARMEALAEAGMGILFVSSDMSEVLGMADRVLVLHEGRISGELARDELSEEAVMGLMAGPRGRRGMSGPDGSGAGGSPTRKLAAWAKRLWAEDAFKKLVGISALFLIVCVLTNVLSDGLFVGEINLGNVTRRTARFGILSIGAAFVIVTGGIDLSIGSLVCISATGLAWLVRGGWDPWLATLLIIGFSACLGLAHGLLVTRLRMQPFVVTLCGLLLYRGIARGVTNDQSQGFGSDHQDFVEAIPAPHWVLLLVAVAAWLFFFRSVAGRRLIALGRNEEAARLSGVRTQLLTVIAYVVCATLAGVGGILFIADTNFAQPSSYGNFYELYAIAGAVLGGCALRGGEVSIAGVLVGTALMQVLANAITLIDWIPSQLEFAVIGAVILIGVSADEVLKRVARKRRT